jgi:formylglycine-generating enzyme required for sulfatase activity
MNARSITLRAFPMVGLLALVSSCSLDVSNPLFQDGDGDGVTPAEGDCDDSNPSAVYVVADRDCDGVATNEDCDDVDAMVPRTDADCDGVQTVEDCDDANANVLAVDGDNDCDGVLTSDDCNDFDATMPTTDRDCDGVSSADDCNDESAQFLAVDNDRDCDGVPTGDDCDDSDASLLAVDNDRDCDGALTAEDCDDGDSALLAVIDDRDCDGTLEMWDCNDRNATMPAYDSDCDGVQTVEDCDDDDATMPTTDKDCDGVLTADDCNDDDASRPPANDRDCDGVLTADDCDDSDASLLAVGDDRDCDGVLTADDCDDNDASLLAVGGDRDCDGVLTADDCDDYNSTLLAVGDDGDCDGVLTADDCDDSDWSRGALFAARYSSYEGCMVRVIGGSFDMGCTAGQASCDSDESPVLPTTLTRDYWMSETEVTQEQFQEVMGYNPSDSRNLWAPVENLTWNEAASFANAVSAAAGLASCYVCGGSGSSVSCSVPYNVYTCTGYRLPTEAEWEGAARCGTDFRYAGSDVPDPVAWYLDNTPSGVPSNVMRKLANGCGLYDMSGNVYEWTNDGYFNLGYPASATDPGGGGPLYSTAVLRGGGFWRQARYQRVSDRLYQHQSLADAGWGFRLARTAP